MNKDKFWLVYSPRSKTPPRVRHNSFLSAETEAGRLAKLNPGRHFYMLEMVGYMIHGEGTVTAREMQILREEKEREAEVSPHDPVV